MRSITDNQGDTNSEINRDHRPVRSDAGELLMAHTMERYFAGGKHLRFGDDGQFWFYNGKLWVAVQDRWIDGQLLECFKKALIGSRQTTTGLISQARRLLQAKLSACEYKFGFEHDVASVINCSNGELWIAEDGTVELRPHRSESNLRHCLAIDYDPDAKCPEYDRAVKEIFAASSMPEDLTRHWNELVGYIIQPGRNIPLVLVLYGKGGNGKTTLMQTVIRLLGSDLVHAQRIESLTESRFAMAALFGKSVMVDDDVKAGARFPDGPLKTVSEAKVVTGERKGGAHFNFVVGVVPVLLCNNIPSLTDLSHGMTRRLTVIPFDRTFDKDKEQGLFDRIWKNELPGVLNRSLEGYARLLKGKSEFEVPTAVTTATQQWLRRANPASAFGQDRCIRDSGSYYPVKEVNAAYRSWSRDAGYAPDRRPFSSYLESLGLAVQDGPMGPVVVGVRLRG